MADYSIGIPKRNISAKRFFEMAHERYGLTLYSSWRRWAQIHPRDVRGNITGAITLRYIASPEDSIVPMMIPAVTEQLGKGWKSVWVEHVGSGDAVDALFNEIYDWLKETFQGIDLNLVPVPPLDPDPVRAAELEAIEIEEQKRFLEEQMARLYPNEPATETTAEGETEPVMTKKTSRHRARYQRYNKRPKR